MRLRSVAFLSFLYPLCTMVPEYFVPHFVLPLHCLAPEGRN